MYKLIAKIKNRYWVTHAPTIAELQRIAANLGSELYVITYNGGVVYRQEAVKYEYHAM